MYNGLGLRTPRGTGTNGFVQRNLSFAKPKLQANYRYDEVAPKPARKPSEGILLHRNKRQIEVECLKYEEELLDSEKYSKEEVKEKVEKFRQKELLKLEEDMKQNNVKVLKEQKETEMDRLRGAFGIRKDAVEGDAFKFESEVQRQERLARYAEDERITKKNRIRDR